MIRETLLLSLGIHLLALGGALKMSTQTDHQFLSEKAIELDLIEFTQPETPLVVENTIEIAKKTPKKMIQKAKRQKPQTLRVKKKFVTSKRPSKVKARKQEVVRGSVKKEIVKQATSVVQTKPETTIVKSIQSQRKTKNTSCRLIKRKLPKGPRGVRGEVHAKFIVEKNGRIGKLRLRSAVKNQALNDEIKKALKQWRFEKGKRCLISQKFVFNPETSRE